MLVINPSECIDCGVCVPECPVNAIISDQETACTEALVDFNGEYARVWPRIREIGVVPPDADAWRDVPDKMRDHFNPAPGGSKP